MIDSVSGSSMPMMPPQGMEQSLTGEQQALVEDTLALYDLENLTEEESQRLLNLGMKIKEQQLALEKKYADRLGSIISNRQLLALRKAEDDFRNMLLQRLEKRREMQRRMQRRRDQSDNN